MSAAPPQVSPHPERPLNPAVAEPRHHSLPRLPAPTGEAPPNNIFKGVRWSLAFTGLIGYVLAITTYRLPIGDVSMAAALLGLVLLGKPLRCPPALVAFGVFIGWCTITGIFSPYHDAVWDRVILLVKLWAIMLVAVNAIRTPAQLRFFNIFWLGCFAFYPLRGALFNFFIYGEKLLGRAKWNNIYENPNDLGAICILFFALSLAVAGGERHRWYRLAAKVGIFMVPFLLVLTKSRGAFLGFAVVVLYVMGSGRRRLRNFGIVFIVALTVAIAAPSGTFDRIQGLSKLTGGTQNLEQVDPEGSAEERYEIWRVARTVIAENPLFGVGVGAYPLAHMRYAGRFTDLTSGARGPRDTHSLYLNVAAETGFVGLFLLCFAYFLGLRSAFQAARKLRARDPARAWQLRTAALGVVGFLIAGIFGSMAYMSFLLLMLMDLHVMRTVMLAAARAPARPRASAVAVPTSDTSLALPPAPRAGPAPVYSPFGRV